MTVGSILAAASLVTCGLALTGEAALGAPPDHIGAARALVALTASVDHLAPDEFAVPPTTAVTVLVPFDPPDSPWLAGHRGVDLASQPGDVIVADRAGEVTFAAVVVDRPVLVIRHADGTRSTFEPVTATVKVGIQVGAGEPVGVLAPSGWHCASACLHWGVIHGDEYRDPLAYLRGHGPVVLLPRSAGVSLPDR